jgi:hypothetical protein
MTVEIENANNFSYEENLTKELPFLIKGNPKTYAFSYCRRLE